MKTAGVKKLVNSALDNLPKPHTEDVIEDVFLEIENEQALRSEYDELCRQLGKPAVNTWGGYWVANALGKTGVAQIPSKRSKLIHSYSQLTATATPPTGKRKEPEALELMSAYYQEHKGRLSPNIRNHRELLVEMIIEGLPVEQVFAMVQVEPVQQAPSQRRR
ncbi:MAG: hypothetical protein ABIP55_04840 [Tepidisphaeraceae bacterium]